MQAYSELALAFFKKFLYLDADGCDITFQNGGLYGFQGEG